VTTSRWRKPLARDPQAVDERAVGAARILEPEVGALAHDAGVMAGDARHFHAEVVVRGRADPQRLADRSVAAGHGSGASDQFHRAARIISAADGGW
jgi:hypothetical protein